MNTKGEGKDDRLDVQTTWKFTESGEIKERVSSKIRFLKAKNKEIEKKKLV